MSLIAVRRSDGITENIFQYSIECPFCHSKIIPNYICLDSFFMFCSCPNSGCGSHFVLSQNSDDEM